MGSVNSPLQSLDSLETYRFDEGVVRQALISEHSVRSVILSNYILGAIRPARGIGAAIITPAANTECINLHLAEISTHIAPGAVAALIWDGAGWHQSGGELNVPENIVMLPPPPYSPELNPMENVWEY